jgi:hypothetical protein
MRLWALLLPPCTVAAAATAASTATTRGILDHGGGGNGSLLPGDTYSTTGLGRTLFSVVLPQLGARHAAVSALGRDREAWMARQGRVRESLRRLFAPLPPRRSGRGTPTPRTLQRGGVLRDELGGFTVTRLLIETRPGYWAPAALWLPLNASAHSTVPAVLFPSGHSDTSFREAGAQLIEQNLVRRGLAVLGYDPVGQGERRMMPDLDGKGGAVARGEAHYSPSFEHEYHLRGINITIGTLDWLRFAYVLAKHRQISAKMPMRCRCRYLCDGAGTCSASRRCSA